MRSKTLSALAVIAAALALAGTDEARNPNCAGGIQYLTQALTDKEKGNTEDYQREIGKVGKRVLATDALGVFEKEEMTAVIAVKDLHQRNR